MTRPRVSQRLPDFPWDHLAEAAQRARAHPEGIVDLSVGTPVDPTPEVIQEALRAAADAPGYPLTIGRVETRQAAIDWLARRHGVSGLGLDGVLPVIGSKELIASLPGHLGVGPGDLVVHPALAYPTYEVGTRAVRGPVAGDRLADLARPRGPRRCSGSTRRPTPPAGCCRWRTCARSSTGAASAAPLLVSDECYLELTWEGEPAVSVLHPDVCGGSLEGILAVHSLSKRSNLAGYRCAFVAGDPALVGELLAVRKNLGLQMPAPQQAAMVAALDGGRGRRGAARPVRRPSGQAAGGASRRPASGSTTPRASLYLWATRDEDCWETVSWLADRGILVAPGTFYAPVGSAAGRGTSGSRSPPPTSGSTPRSPGWSD